MTSIPNSSPTVRARTRTAPLDGGISALALDKALALKVTKRPLSELKPSPRNARTHSKKQINQVADSIRVFGFVNPILVDGNNEIVAGHGRYAAAKLLEMTSVPVICLDHLTPDEIRAYRIADNRLAESAGWDDELLKLELGHLVDIEFEVELTGFDTPQIEFLLSGEHAVQKADPADEVAPVAEQAVTQLGDLWLLDEHRVFCGDARERASYEKLMGGALAQMTFTDPPYNVAIDGHVGGLGKIKHRPFAMASGEMSKAQFTAFLKGVFGEIKGASQDGALVYTCIDGQHFHEMLTAGHEAFDELKAVICWAKTNAGMGSLYRAQTELIPLWKVGKAAHVNNIELGRHGRYRTTLWTYAGANGFRKGRMEDLASHPTVKPCAMVMEAIKDCSKRNGIILDVFGGNGTTLIAAAKTKRWGYLMELDPLYVDVAVKRWETLFKREARHAETGLTFAEMAMLRDQAAAGATQNMGGYDVA
ncbi:site-specific DNA-methyltransferase [Bosea lathyri]|uniref:site-specific DNA-methyltransferase (adenine-specific) n=1 Tax=Bosea lathyri TaxID=1036778 RepID=A0A1H6D583_9HYPH|nr:DNA methyltransferase [Bosea lathyri]SEG80411.1 DNA modification methylase [Bosea lathyri]